LAVGHFAQAAVTIENVGGSLGLGAADLKETIINIIKWALGLLGLIAVIVMLYGGFVWLTSRGDEKKIDKAKRILLNGVIGLVIILVSWAIVLFIQRFITGATSGSASEAQCGPAATPPIAFGPTSDTCIDCVDTGPIGDGFGTYVYNGCLPPPGSFSWQAVSEVPAVAETNVSLCSAVVETYGGMPNPLENRPSTGTLSVEELQADGTSYTPPVFVPGPTDLGLPWAQFSHIAQDFKATTKYRVTRAGFLNSSAPPQALLPPAVEWTFTTGTEGDETLPVVSTVYPADPTPAACLKPTLTVTFSEAMLPSSLHPDNVTYFDNATSAPASTGAKIVSVIPSSDLKSIDIDFDKPLDRNKTYTVNLNASQDTTPKPSSTGDPYIEGFKDMCIKNALDGKSDGAATVGHPADDYVWTFTTADTDVIDCTPKIESIQPTGYYGNDAGQAAQQFLIKGQNFGSVAHQVLFSGVSALATNVAGSGSSCFNSAYRPRQAAPLSAACIAGWTNTQITTLVPAGLTPSQNASLPASSGAVDGPLWVQKGMYSVQSASSMSVESPHIDWVSPDNGKIGTTITIAGTHFGSVAGEVYFRHPDGTQVPATVAECANPNGWLEDVTSPERRSQIIVLVPDGFIAGDFSDIQIQRSDIIAPRGRSNLYRFSVNDQEYPGLCKIVPSCHEAGGGTLTAYGSNFGDNLGALQGLYTASTGTTYSSVSVTNLNPNVASVQSTSQANIPFDPNYRFQLQVGTKLTNPVQYAVPCTPAPRVDESAACSLPGTMPSPNPYPGSMDVCRNSKIQVRFNQAMVATDLADSNNFKLEQCGAGSTFTCAAPVVVDLPFREFVTPTEVITYSHAGTFQPDTWYRMTLVGANIHSAVPPNVALGADYVWTFHVRPGNVDCAYDAVAVSPQQAGPLYTFQTQKYTATPTNAQCALLTNIAGAFTWNVTANPGLVSLAPPTTEPADASPAANNVLATVQTGPTDGTSTITATLSGKSGSGDLIVQRNYCDTDLDCQGRWNDPVLPTYQCTGSTCNVATHECRPWIRELQSGTQVGLAVDGPRGNLINVRGCFFGSTKGSGEVTFTNGGTSENGSFAICGPAGWGNDSIRVQAMPENDPPASNGTPWTVRVIADNSLQSTNTGTYTIAGQCSTNLGGVTNIPATGVPILCGITPPAGREGDSIAYSGSRFVAGSSQAFFTQATGAVNQLGLTGGSTAVPSTTAMTSQVPGLTGIPLTATTAQTTVGVASIAGYCVATPVDFAVSCNQNSECSTGCCQTNICRLAAACTNDFIAGYTFPGGSCRNTQFDITFNASKTIVPSSVNTSTIQLRRIGVPDPVSTTVQLVGQVATIRPAEPLVNGSYTIHVQGGSAGVLATDGTFLPDLGYTTPNYDVTPAFTICTIASVAIHSATGTQPVIASDLFTCAGDACGAEDISSPTPPNAAGNQHAYIVRAYDATGAGPLTLSSVTWTQSDTGTTPGPSNTFVPSTSGGPCPVNETSEGYCATGQSVPSGSEQLTVNVVGTGSSGTGSTAIPINAFMCTNTWPAAALFPFRDPVGVAPANVPTHDFTFGFCRDDVNMAQLSFPPTQSAPSGEVRKEYFMFVLNKDGVNTGDTIGVRIIGSPTSALGVYQQDLSPKRWYERTFGKPSTGTTFEVDGYPALREGRTVYVVADYMPPGDSLSYPAVYVFSHTDNARPETVQIFEQVIKNIRFNNRAGIDGPTKVDLRNDLKRFHAMHEVVYAIAGYYRKNGKNPMLDTGTYIKNMTMTPWPSWQQEFGQVLGVSLPADPQGLWDPAASPRQLPTFCDAAAGFNQTTCWDEADKLMQFPSNGTNPPESTALAYVRHADGTASVYSTGSVRSASHMTGPHQALVPPLPDICTGASVCQGFNLEILSNDFSKIDDARQKPPADTVDPVVSITSPPAGSIAGAVTFVATATDNVGVNAVTFAIGGASSTVVTPGTDGKYRWTWNSRSVLNKNYILTVTAIDRSNNDAVVTRSYTVANPPGDNEPPVLTAPAPPDQDGAKPGIQWNGSNVDLTASATDVHPAPSPAVNNTGVSKIEFFLGASKIGQSPNPACAAACPGTYAANVTVPGATITGFPNGTYTYTVVAYDGYGNTSAVTNTVTVAKINGESPAIPPTVTITLPGGAPPVVVSGANTDVVAEASDASGIDRVEFYIDAEVAPRAVDFNGPYSFSWELAGYANGSPHTVRAVAYDRYGNQATASQNVTYNLLVAQDTQRPTVSDLMVTLATGVTVPMDGAQLKDLVTLRATLTDNLAIARGELRIDGAKIPLVLGAYSCDASGQVCTIAFPWNTLVEDVDQHTVSITAYDNAGFVTTVSQTVSVTNQVLMSISSPLSGTTVQDSAASGTCEETTSRTCLTYLDCPATSLGYCDSDPGDKCASSSDCPPGDFCKVPRESCIGGGAVGVPIVVTVSDTCRDDLLLSVVGIYLDSVLLTTIPNCNGTCSYIWNSKATTSNGSHILTAVGRDSLNCRGGDTSNVIVNNVVNDTVPPVIDSLSFNGVQWPGTGDVYVTGSGLISVMAHDPPGGSGMGLVTIEVKDSGGTQLALQTCSTADALTPNPCQFTWVPNDGGGYQVVVNAQDVAGNDAATRTQIVHVDSTAPQVAWTSPADGSTVNSPPNVTLTAGVTDPQTNGYASGIASVVFRQNGIAFAPPATSSGGSYSGTYPLAVGANQLFSAVVTDQAGNTSTTPNVSLTVVGLDTTAPVVSTITSPSVDNWFFKGTTTITAAAVDNAGGSGIGSVQFYLDGAPLGAPDIAGPYTVAWDTTTATDGQTYSVTARACDRAATPNCLTSSPRLMRVWNSAGTICRTTICSGGTPYCCASGCSASSCTITAL